MSKVYTDPDNYTNIANAIRYKNGSSDTYKPSEMPQAIRDIITDPTIEALTVTQNGIYTAPAGVDGYSPVNVSVSGGEFAANIYWHIVKICAGDPSVVIHSDCELKLPLDMADFTLSENITALTALSNLELQASLDDVAAGDEVSLSGNFTCYQYRNGTADDLIVLVQEVTPNDTYEPVSSLTYKRNVLNRMTVIRNNVYLDEGSDTITFSTPFRGVGFGASSITSFSVNANSYITCGNLTINVNQRDSSVYYVWKEESLCGSLPFMKIRWKGASAYNGSIDHEFEVVYLGNGDIIIRLIKKGSSSGTYTFKGTTYTITTDCPLCCYRRNYYGMAWDLINEEYDFDHHYSESDELYKIAAFEDYKDSLSEGYTVINNVGYDDNTYSFNLDSSFTWHSLTSITVSGNSWMGIGGSNEDVRMHRRDSKMYYLYVCYWELSDLDDLKAVQISWRGASKYNGSIDRWWSLWLFENGDAMIYISTYGNSGTCDFFGQSYTGTAGSFTSFYYDSTAGNYDIQYESYNPEHHIG